MLYNMVYIFAEVLLYFVVMDWISYEIIPVKNKIRMICFLILILVRVVLIEMQYRETVFSFMVIFVLLFYLIWSDKNKRFLLDFSMVISAVMLDIIIVVALSIPFSYISFLLLESNDGLYKKIVFSMAEIGLCILIKLGRTKIPIYKLYMHKGARIISVIMGIALITLRQAGIYMVDENHDFSIIIATVLFFTIIIGILWLLDHYRLAADKQKVEQDNRQMNSNLHKTKELMPLLISVVNENEGLLDPQLVDEFNQIYSEQMISERKENMNYKLMGTTGMKLLDSQLQHYILECNGKGITMDVFVSEPVGKQIHGMEIPQLMMHNVVGDLLRNAIRAIERSGRKDGKILVIVGEREDTVEADIFDNGEAIPLEVLEKFGERGVTTGGTGNGLADIAEVLADYRVSLVIKENEPEKSAYVKGFLLVFDGKNRRELITGRKEAKKLAELGFWDVNPQGEDESGVQ